MELLMVIIHDSSAGDATLSFMGWFGFFVTPVVLIASVYFGFQTKKVMAEKPLENEELFDHLFK